MNRRRVALALAAPLVALAVWVVLTPLPEELRAGAPQSSIRVTDADGRLLREVRAGDGSRARYATLDELGQTARAAVLAAEDRRFYSHPGVDPVAVARAAVSAVTHLKVVSGASTLTMQLARTVHPHGRNAWGKVQEMVLALRIEASLSKDRILEEYMNRVAFGPNLRGFAAASQSHFGKPPDRLSVAEAALIAGLPRGPSLYSLSRRKELAERRRNRVVDRLEAMGAITADVAERARTEPLVPGVTRPAFGAPHLVQGIVGGTLRRLSPGLDAAFHEPVTGVTTTLDGELQRAAETAVTAGLRELAGKQVTAASAVVLDNATGDVLAYVGSPDFFDESRLGQNDGARALRQPGSTLKPFLYALALEKLGFTAATALPDVETRFPSANTDGGVFIPHDYDGKVRGPVRLREALGNSLNIPAVWTLVQMGVEPFLGRLHDLGFTSLTESPSYYGPALALGDGEVTLLQLANAYATLARGGVLREVRVVREVTHAGGASQELPVAESRRVMPALVATQITEILRDPHARTASFGGRTVLDFDYPVAAKTGTSKGYRDNWVVGYTDTVTVAVWAGNFDGSSMGQVSGIAGAGPIFHAVMDAAVRARGASMPSSPHEGLRRVHVCALSGGLATSDCPHAVDEWVAPDAVVESCTMHEHLRVTRADGLRAGPACSSDDVVEHVYERFSPEYREWAAGASRPTAPEEYSALCPGPVLARSAGHARIVYPTDGARFAMDPERDPSLQILGVRLSVPEGTREVALLVDGSAVASVRSPFIASWPLVPGEHVLAVRAENGEVSDRIGVQVRGL